MTTSRPGDGSRPDVTASGEPVRLRQAARASEADSDPAFIARLLDANPPYVASDDRSASVRQRIAEASAPKPQHWLRPTIVAIAAAAIVGASWQAATRLRSPSGNRAGSTHPTSPDVAPAADAAILPQPQPAPALVDPARPTDLDRPPTPAPIPSIPGTGARSPATPPPALPEGDEWRVARAVRALRREHDPRRASVLLAEYLARQPDGLLAEEAYALSFEAAASIQDPATATLCARYLDKYPKGRFAEAARRTQKRFRQ